ncbi:MAG: hypothetical protein HYW77_03520 [Parcubacteria group bacterium]|nr:hypothetical protein [Parcubacteria group bacterium]
MKKNFGLGILTLIMLISIISVANAQNRGENYLRYIFNPYGYGWRGCYGGRYGNGIFGYFTNRDRNKTVLKLAELDANRVTPRDIPEVEREYMKNEIYAREHGLVSRSTNTTRDMRSDRASVYLVCNESGFNAQLLLDNRPLTFSKSKRLTVYPGETFKIAISPQDLNRLEAVVITEKKSFYVKLIAKKDRLIIPRPY